MGKIEPYPDEKGYMCTTRQEAEDFLLEMAGDMGGMEFAEKFSEFIDFLGMAEAIDDGFTLRETLDDFWADELMDCFPENIDIDGIAARIYDTDEGHFELPDGRVYFYI